MANVYLIKPLEKKSIVAKRAAVEAKKNKKNRHSP